MQAPYGTANHGGEGGYEYGNTDNMAAFGVKSVRMAFIRLVFLINIQLLNDLWFPEKSMVFYQFS